MTDFPPMAGVSRWHSNLRGIALLLFLVAGVAFTASARTTPQALAEVALADLPKEARDVHALVGSGGPFPFDRDGIVFGNRE